MFRLAVVILNYRTAKLTIDCINSMVGQLSPSEDQIIVVDNASGDDSIIRLKMEIAERGWDGLVSLAAASVNGGFSAGNNLGIQKAPASAYWLTNSDTLFRPGAVETALAELEARPNAGILSPRLEWQNGVGQISCFNYPTPGSELLDAAKTGAISRLLSRFVVPIPVTDTPFRPQWTSFASVLLRAKTVQEVGLMDERFFMYFEDVDYCRRAAKVGWQIWHAPSARVVHLRGQSGEVKQATRQRSKRPAYYYASRAHYYIKFYGKLGFWLANFCWEAGRGVALVREIAGNKQPHTCKDEWRDIWIDSAPQGARA